MRLDPLTHSRPTCGFDGESGLKSLYTLTVNGLSFDVMFDPVVTNHHFKYTSLYRNCCFLKENVINFNPLSTHSLKLKPKGGSTTPFSMDPPLFRPWVDRGSGIGFTVDKTSTHAYNNQWTEWGADSSTQPTLIGTLKGAIRGSGRVLSSGGMV